MKRQFLSIIAILSFICACELVPVTPPNQEPEKPKVTPLEDQTQQGVYTLNGEDSKLVCPFDVKKTQYLHTTDSFSLLDLKDSHYLEFGFANSKMNSFTEGQVMDTKINSFGILDLEALYQTSLLVYHVNDTLVYLRDETNDRAYILAK